MKMNKKTVILILATLVIVAILITGTVLTINAINNNNATKPAVIPTASTAKSLQDQAEEARKNNDTEKAKALLTQAQQQYETIPKTDKTTNAQADIDAQLHLLDQTTKPTPTEAQP